MFARRTPVNRVLSRELLQDNDIVEAAKGCRRMWRSENWAVAHMEEHQVETVIVEHAQSKEIEIS